MRRRLTAGELAVQPVEPDGAVECAGRGVQAWVELVQVPAQSLLAATSLVNEIVAVVDQQLQLAQRLFARTGTVKLAFLQPGSGDRECVDRVRLPACPAAMALRSR